ncbi:hypothetical protein C8Q77DRAFT_361830 [Trametes polyzona]|nr:hypothetical protein C8Q77DRAFT_361830 [Trametes polyzona]
MTTDPGRQDAEPGHGSRGSSGLCQIVPREGEPPCPNRASRKQPRLWCDEHHSQWNDLNLKYKEAGNDAERYRLQLRQAEAWRRVEQYSKEEVTKILALREEYAKAMSEELEGRVECCRRFYGPPDAGHAKRIENIERNLAKNNDKLKELRARRDADVGREAEAQARKEREDIWKVQNQEQEATERRRRAQADTAAVAAAAAEQRRAAENARRRTEERAQQEALAAAEEANRAQRLARASETEPLISRTARSGPAASPQQPPLLFQAVPRPARTGPAPSLPYDSIYSRTPNIDVESLQEGLHHTRTTNSGSESFLDFLKPLLLVLCSVSDGSISTRAVG